MNQYMVCLKPYGIVQHCIFIVLYCTNDHWKLQGFFVKRLQVGSVRAMQQRVVQCLDHLGPPPRDDDPRLP